MTPHERRAVGQAVTRVWRAAVALADDEPRAARHDLEEALRELIRLLPDGDAVVATLSASAGPVGAELTQTIRQQEGRHEPARQRQLALDDAE